MQVRLLTLSVLLVLSVGEGLGAQHSTVVDPPSCDSIPGIAPLMRPGSVLLLGELHGTRESPAFVLAVACNATERGLDLVVGLELSPAAQEAVDVFLGSAGTPADRSALVAHRLWQSAYQDGRTSCAIVDLLEGLRSLRHTGQDVKVVLFDASGAEGGQRRERDMAAHLAESVRRSPEAFHLVLTGNLHSRTVRGTVRNRDYQPMGYLLGRSGSLDRLTALDVAHDGGSAWLCNPDCGVSRIGGRGSEPPWSVEIDEATRPSGHDGWYHVGQLSASSPASTASCEGPYEGPRPAPARTQSSPTEDPVAGNTAPKKEAPAGAAEVGPPASVEKWQGRWQAFQYGTRSWTLRIDGSKFRGDLGSDDWYTGNVVIRTDASPAEIDFEIEDCRCDCRGQTSQGIFRWDGDSVVLSAPRPGGQRPTVFDENSGEVVRLKRMKD